MLDQGLDGLPRAAWEKRAMLTAHRLRMGFTARYNGAGHELADQPSRANIQPSRLGRSAKDWQFSRVT